MKDPTDQATQELMLDGYAVIYKGKQALRLNARLVMQKGLTQEQLEIIKQLHVERLTIEECMESAASNTHLKYLFEEWTQNQFALQRVWGFPEDINFHPSHRLPGCTCGAMMDNDERLGTPYRVITQGCPIHDVGGNFE